MIIIQDISTFVKSKVPNGFFFYLLLSKTMIKKTPDNVCMMKQEARMSGKSTPFPSSSLLPHYSLTVVI